MSDTIDYAEMLEIPVNTLNVTKKRSKKRRETEDLKERVLESVNEKLDAEEEEPRVAQEENVVDYGAPPPPEEPQEVPPHRRFLSAA